MRIMVNLDVQFYEEALITHDLNVTWNNIENKLRQTNGRDDINREADWYRRGDISTSFE